MNRRGFLGFLAGALTMPTALVEAAVSVATPAPILTNPLFSGELGCFYNFVWRSREEIVAMWPINENLLGPPPSRIKSAMVIRRTLP